MSDSLQEFLNETPGAKPSLHLAAFGKHPGWDDHLDDFGFETESLVGAKQLIYLQGLASQIDAAAWEDLAPNKRLRDFNHLLLWTGRTGFIAGAIWSSQDGKGRAKYPMVLCAHAVGAPPEWALALFPVLEGLKAACQATPSADEVRRILTEGRERLRAELARAASPPASGGQPAEPAGAARPALHRVLYEIFSQMKELSPGVPKGRRPMELPSRRLRVPATPADSRALAGWTRLVRSQLDPEVPLLGMAACEGGWVDLVAGRPSAQDFFCLRATTVQLPLTTEIPYTLEPAFVAAADAVLDDLAAQRDSGRTIFGERPAGGFMLFPWAAGAGGGVTFQAEPGPAHPAPPSLKWVKAGFILLVAIIIGVTIYFASRNG